jgi:hypothetical protein
VTPETKVKKDIKNCLDKLGIFWFWIYSPNNRCKTGLPDLMMHYKGEVKYLEIKSPNGKLTESQLAFQKQCECDRIDYWVIHSMDELLNKLGGVG